MTDGVNLIGFINGKFGLGSAVSRFRKVLIESGIPFNTNQLLAPQHKYGSEIPVTKYNNYQTNIIFVNPDSLAFLPAGYMDNKRNIGVFYWELEVVPELWKTRSLLFDEIWVESTFMKEIFEKELPNKNIKLIKVAPSPPVELDPVECKAQFGIKPDEFLFLFAFDFHSTIERKNPMAVIDSFKTAMASDCSQKMKLIIKSNNASVSDKANLDWYIREDKNIIHEADYYSQDKMDKLFNACDTYVSLHRSEGLGLTIIDAILLNKRIICTNYGGNTDFCKDSFCKLINYDLIPVPEDTVYIKWLHAFGSKWANPDEDMAAIAMKEVYQDYKKGKTIERGAAWMVENFNMNECVRQLKENLCKI